MPLKAETFCTICYEEYKDSWADPTYAYINMSIFRILNLLWIILNMEINLFSVKPGRLWLEKSSYIPLHMDN